jgi:hypothetical protein
MESLFVLLHSHITLESLVIAVAVATSSYSQHWCCCSGFSHWFPNSSRSKSETAWFAGQGKANDKGSAGISGEETAAIAMALHLYLSEIHDTESGVLTIKHISKRYSPWSSKIYAVRNQFNRILSMPHRSMKHFKFSIHGNDYSVDVHRHRREPGHLEVNGTAYSVQLQQKTICFENAHHCPAGS